MRGAHLSHLCRLVQSVEKGKLTKEGAEAELKAIEGRIDYTLELEDLKDVDLVVEVREGDLTLICACVCMYVCDVWERRLSPGGRGWLACRPHGGPCTLLVKTQSPAFWHRPPHTSHRSSHPPPHTGHRGEPRREDPLLQEARGDRQALGHLRLQHLLARHRRLRAALRPPGEVCECSSYVLPPGIGSNMGGI
jgi:hypothetical protein